MKSDRGSGPVTVVLILGVIALLMAVGLTGVLAAASEERSSAQHAADAAALAGAQGVVDKLGTSLAGGFEDPRDIAQLLGGGTCLQVGRSEASQLAAANGASLTSYCFNVFRDEVTTKVAMNATSVDSTSKARAEASTTFEASSCHLDPAFDRPSPSPSPTEDDEDDGDDDGDDDSDPPPPPKPQTTWVDCGFGHLDVTFNLADLRFHFSDLPGIGAGLTPVLTG